MMDMQNSADFSHVTIEYCLKLYNAGMAVEISNGEVIGFDEENPDE